MYALAMALCLFTVHVCAADHAVDPNALDVAGETALTRATSSDIIYNNAPEVYEQMIANLVERGADINQPDARGITPLEKARLLLRVRREGLSVKPKVAKQRAELAIKVLRKYGAQ